MATSVLLAIGFLFGHANAMRVEDENALQNVLSTADVKSEMSRLKRLLDNALSAYDREQTKANYDNLQSTLSEASSMLNDHKDEILALQANFIETFDAHAAKNAELAEIKDQVDAADAALKEEARKQSQALKQRKAAMTKLKSELSGVSTKLNQVVQQDIEAPSVSDLNQIVKQTDLAEKSLSATLNKAQTVQSGIVAKAQAMKSQESTMSEHRQMLALGNTKKEELSRLVAQLKVLNVDAQFLQDSGAVNMDIVNAERSLENTKCPFGQFSHDGNGHTGCTPCSTMKAQLIDDNFGDIRSHWGFISRLTGRKTQADLEEALTYTSQPGAEDYKQCVPKLCCGVDGIFGWIPPNGLGDKFACPKFMPEEDKAKCNEDSQTVTSHS